MPGWAKALIIIVILGLLLVVGVIGAGVYWFSRNKDAQPRDQCIIYNMISAGSAT